MNRVKVSMGEAPWWYLKYLYSDIEKDTVGRVVYTSGMQEFVSEGRELELVEDVAGFNMSKREGLLVFLKEQGYFSDGKQKRIEHYGMVKKQKWVGGKVQEFEEFEDSVENLYRCVATLRVANRNYRGISEADIGFMLEFLDKPLDERIELVTREGTEALCFGVLSTIYKALDREGQKQMYKGYVQQLHDLMRRFDKKGFKEGFESTEDWRDDLMYLMFLFRDIK